MFSWPVSLWVLWVSFKSPISYLLSTRTTFTDVSVILWALFIVFEYSELSNVMFYVFYRWANMLFKLFWRPCFLFKNFALFILLLFLGVFRLSNASLILSCSIFSFSILYFSFCTIYAFSKNSLYSWPFINCSAR